MSSLLLSLRKSGLIAAIFSFFLIFHCSPILAASNAGLEADLQESLRTIQKLTDKALAKIQSGSDAGVEIGEIKGYSDILMASDLLLKERFVKGAEKANALGVKAGARHNAVLDKYRRSMGEVIRLVNSLSDAGSMSASGNDQQGTLTQLKALLKQLLPKKRRPIHGALPYRHLNLPALLPVSNINVTPAYRGGSAGSLPEDLAASEEAPISKEMTDLAASLNWNPVEIYEYVKNNIHSEWYYGCMKGAQVTARQKSGNDCDQAALLVALLRASGFPSRYVTGTIEFFGGMEQAKNLTGIDEPMNIARFLQKAGIPYEPVIAGGKMVNFRFSHVWVDSYIPYSNYRGAVIDGHGKTWLGLDTFIKPAGYIKNGASHIDGFVNISSVRDNYLSGLNTNSPLEYLTAYINSELEAANVGLTYDDFLHKRTLRPEILNIIPSGLQFKQIAVTGESAKLPDALKQKVRFTAKAGAGENILDLTLDTIKVAGKRIALTYEPETIDDQEIINAWGGLDNTPSYLVRLRPVLTIDGERMAVATGGLAMGSDYEVTVELHGAGSNVVEKITNTHIAGNLSVIGIGTRSITKVHKEKSAEILLFEEAKNYTNRWSEAEEELASLLNLAIARPLPSVVTLGGAIDVAYLFDTPHGFEWTGVFMDADFRAIEVIPCSTQR